MSKCQKKQNIKLVLIIFIIISCVITQKTYSRYAYNKNGNNNVDIAKWNISINDNLNVNNDVIEFNLFDTVNTNLKSDEKLIAPGSNGKFTLEIKNNSEVIVEYILKLTETNNHDIPIEYSLTGLDDSWVEDIKEININNEAIEINKIKLIDIYWRWAYYKDKSQNDKDNDLKNKNANIKIKMNIDVNQKISEK